MEMLEDVLEVGLGVVFCGTAAGSRSAELRQYYAGRGNSFLQVLHAVGLTPRVLDPSEFLLLPAYGIGLTDIVKDQAGMDQSIAFRGTSSEALRHKIEHCAPRFLCFNGKLAAKVFFRNDAINYGLHDGNIGLTRLFVAPSTSAAAGAFCDQGLWQNLADLVRRTTVAA